VLGLEDFMTIQPLVKRRVCLCDIAEQSGVHPRTIRRALGRESARSLPARGRSVVERGSVEHGGGPPGAAGEGLRRRRLDSPGLRPAQAGAAGWQLGDRALRDGAGPTAANGLGRPARSSPGRPVAVHFAVSTLSYSRRFHFWERSARMPSTPTRPSCAPSSGSVAFPPRSLSTIRRSPS
jgi:hypothetical protein